MAWSHLTGRDRPLRIHLIGIGGAGMSGLAEVLKAMRYSVSGSDIRQSPILNRLREQGITVYLGHDPAHVSDADLVVYSSAIPPNNAELREARLRHIPIFHRAEMLAEIMRLKRGIAVFGSHGKTTTTSLIAYLLEQAGWDPTVMIGGRLKLFAGHGKWGGGEFMVVETDESDGSFLHFYPEMAVLLNLDEEHLDYWQTMEALEQKVVEFANRIPFYGTIFVCDDDPRLHRLLPQMRRRVVTYGIDTGELRGEIIRFEKKGMVVCCEFRGEKYGPFLLPLYGEHNLSNALAALGVGAALGLNPAHMVESLAAFPGVERRFEILLDQGATTVVHDYGHHPTEIAATLSALAMRFPQPHWVIWQPHRYTRTRLLWDRFKAVAHRCAHFIVTEIYPAGEAPLPEIESQRFVAELKREGHPDASYVPLASLQNYLKTQVPEPRVLIFFGAGSIGAFAHEFAQMA